MIENKLACAPNILLLRCLLGVTLLPAKAKSKLRDYNCQRTIRQELRIEEP